VMLGEARLTTNAIPPWRHGVETSLPVPGARRASFDSRSAILRAREAFRERVRTPDRELLPFDPEFQVAKPDQPEADPDPVLLSDPVEEPSRPHQPLPVAPDVAAGPEPIAEMTPAHVQAAPDDEAVWWDDPLEADWAGVEEARAEITVIGEAAIEDGPELPLADSVAFDWEDERTLGPDTPSGQWTIEYRPKPRERWDWQPPEMPAIAHVQTPDPVEELDDLFSSADSMVTEVREPERAVDDEWAFDWSETREAAVSQPAIDLATAAIDHPQHDGPAASEADQSTPAFSFGDAADGSGWQPPVALDLAPGVPRNCRTCRDFRPGEGGGRGWCGNAWAFRHRRMVDPDEPAACASVLGSWWLPADELYLGDADISAHAQATPHLDRWMPRTGDQDRQRRPS
jgi:hypothetical protein